MIHDTPDPRAPAPDVQPEPIATGDRRDEVHFEADPNQLVVMRTLVRPDGPLPLQITTQGAGDAAQADTPPVEDVRVAPQSPSVWDARPPAESTGH